MVRIVVIIGIILIVRGIMSSFTAGTTFRKYGLAKKCYLVDATDMVLGRLASEIAKILRGKHKADFTPHIDSGDMVIVTNADKVALTGKKLDNDIFYWHTGYPGGVKERSKRQILESKYPERVLLKAVERMMPKESPLARKQMKCLHVYAGSEHPHHGQQPEVIDMASRNTKNKRK